MSHLDRIVSDPKICHGRACIKGTRIMASVVLDNFAGGATHDEIRANYPSLTEEDVLAAMEYGAVFVAQGVSS
jgi:uncharacterized protein (DUF433 family)